MQITLEMDISGETGGIFHLYKGNPSMEDAVPT